MKFPFFKSLVLVGALVVAWNCSDSPNFVNSLGDQAFEQVKTLNIGGQSVYINDNNEVKDANGNIIGTYDPQTLTIIGTQGETILENVKKDELQTTQIGTDTQAGGQESGSGDSFQGGTGSQESTYGGQGGIYGGQQTGGQGTQQTGGQSGQQTGGQGGQQTGGQGGQQTGGQGGQQTGGQGGQQTGGNTDNPPASGDGKCYDKLHNQYVDPYAQGLRGPNDENYSFDDNCSMVCWWSKDNNQCSEVKKALAGGGGQQTGGQSSSSKYVASSSSSVSGGGQQTSGCPNIVITGGGGSGWATRYWDGCKPSCSWTGNAGGKLARQCTSESKGKQTSSNWDAGSVCDGGGNMMACTSQIPFTVNGCSEMAFAFAAVPASNGGQCGKCFQLTFTGEGNWETTANHKDLEGKRLIIMVTNVGHDVQQGQFDIMIPGGGPGAFNATSRYGWGAQGEQYGGLLSNCESESGWDGDFASKRKTCLENKCKNAFGGDSEAIQGCLFLATWMNAAGNPKHNYVEVDCPQVLKDRY
ncbi:MAG: hypothetical protein MJY47_07375 [Fibrobacter sp.]|nr:hypothetical protein [Fibrobacter sp.]